MREPVSIYQSFPLSVRQLRVEMGRLERKIKESESNPVADKQEATLMRMELLTLKEKVKAYAAVPYEPALEVNKAQLKALRDLFDKLDGFIWSNRFGWIGQSKTPLRQEIGVLETSPYLYDGLNVEKIHEEGVESVTIKALNFAGFGCRGELPNSFGPLSQCESVNISFNLLHGPLPRSMRYLVAVKNLDLSCNNISGRLEGLILENCVNMIVLNLSFNNFSGDLPDCFEQLANLERLDLSGNRFAGYLPTSIASLTRLQELKLYNNELIGSIPEEYAALVCLKAVNLSQNQFSSGLNVFNNCLRLERLILNHNQFQETIFPSIGQLKRLKFLYLQHNRIRDILPEELCRLNKLQHLNISHNQLRGCIPDNIGDMTSLQSLLLHHNNIIGPVPLSIKNLQSLRDFFIFRPYPGEFSMPVRKFSRQHFERVYVFGPSVGINSIHWSYKDVYGRDRLPADNYSVTLFSGKL